MQNATTYDKLYARGGVRHQRTRCFVLLTAVLWLPSSNSRASEQCKTTTSVGIPPVTAIYAKFFSYQSQQHKLNEVDDDDEEEVVQMMLILKTDNDEDDYYYHHHYHLHLFTWFGPQH